MLFTNLPSPLNVFGVDLEPLDESTYAALKICGMCSKFNPSVTKCAKGHLTCIDCCADINCRTKDDLKFQYSLYCNFCESFSSFTVEEFPIELLDQLLFRCNCGSLGNLQALSKHLQLTSTPVECRELKQRRPKVETDHGNSQGFGAAFEFFRKELSVQSEKTRQLELDESRNSKRIEQLEAEIVNQQTMVQNQLAAMNNVREALNHLQISMKDLENTASKNVTFDILESDLESTRFLLSLVSKEWGASGGFIWVSSQTLEEKPFVCYRVFAGIPIKVVLDIKVIDGVQWLSFFASVDPRSKEVDYPVRQRFLLTVYGKTGSILYTFRFSTIENGQLMARSFQRPDETCRGRVKTIKIADLRRDGLFAGDRFCVSVGLQPLDFVNLLDDPVRNS